MSREIVTVLMLGLVAGLQATLLAIGLVLIYQAQRFINFAQAQMGLVAASALGVLVMDHDVPYPFALVIAVALGVGVGYLVQRLFSWRLPDASPTTLVIATIGISQVLLIASAAGPLKIDATKAATEGYPLPFDAQFDVGGYTLNTSEIITIIVGPLLVLALQLFITRTKLGTSIRGVASNREAAMLAGISVRRTAITVWMLAGGISAIAAILFAPSRPAGTLATAGTGLLLPGLAAALAGGLSDFRVTLGAGLALGLIQQGVLFWVHIPGSSDLAVFGFLVVMLVVRSKILPPRDDAIAALKAGTDRTRHLPSTMGRGGWVALFGVLLLLPLFPGLQTQEKALLLTLILVYAITGLALLVLTGWSGQVSLGQFAFVGFGAYIAARMFDQNLSAPIVLLNAGLCTAGAAVIVGLPTLRLGKFFTAIVTLGFAYAAQSWLFRQEWLTGNDTGFMRVDRIHVLGTEIRTARGVYVFGVVVVLLVVLLLASVRKSSMGRAMIATRDNEDRVSSDGISPTKVKLFSLALSGFLCGLGGTVWAMATRQWTFDSFEPTTSLVVLSAAIVGSLSVLYGPILGAFAVYAWPFLVPDSNTIVIRSLSSGALLLVILLFARDGIAGLLREQATRLLGVPSDDSRPQIPPSLVFPREIPEPGPGHLRAESISKHFGGIVAVNDASVFVEDQEIVGLMGGNGAGKSTLLDCLSGRLAPDHGTVELGGIGVVYWTPSRRAGAGLARTYQDAALYEGLSVRETMLMAIERINPTGAISGALGTPWAHLAELEKLAHCDAMLERFGMLPYADRLTSELSTGMRRICELAAAVAPKPTVILLDEPTAGLAQREVEAFAERIRGLRDEYGASLLIVEHDIPLLVGMCDRLYCLEQGAVIAEGHPQDVVSDPRVIASCLGTDVTAIQRSGTSLTRTPLAQPAGRGRQREPLRTASVSEEV